jgi:hypothetical protein
LLVSDEAPVLSGRTPLLGNVVTRERARAKNRNSADSKGGSALRAAAARSVVRGPRAAPTAEL